MTELIRTVFVYNTQDIPDLYFRYFPYDVHLTVSLDGISEIVESPQASFVFQFTPPTGDIFESGVGLIPFEQIEQLGPETVNGGSGDGLGLLNGGTATNVVINGGWETIDPSMYVVLTYSGSTDPLAGGYDTATGQYIDYEYGDNPQGLYPLDYGEFYDSLTYSTGGTATDTGATIYAGGQDIESGGTANDASIYGGTQLVDGGVANNTTVYNGGVQDVADGTAYNTIVNSGGLEEVGQTTATTTTVSSGGMLELFGGVLAGNNTDNGTLEAIGANIPPIGEEAAISATTLTGALTGTGLITNVPTALLGGYPTGGFVVANGGSVGGDLTLAGGIITVSSGGREAGLTLGNGATLDLLNGAIYDGGVAFATTASNAAAPAATLELPAPTSLFTGAEHPITNLGMGDYIELANLSASDVTFPVDLGVASPGTVAASGVINVQQNGATVATLYVQGNFAGLGFNWNVIGGNTYIWVGPSLFTEGFDTVIFDQLSAAQTALINNGAYLYDSYDGNDTVTLPNIANYQLTPSVAWNPNQTFLTGDGIDTIQGGDGTDTIQLGGGLGDIVYGSPGNDSITGNSSGAFTVDYTKGEFANFANFGAGPTDQTIVGKHKLFAPPDTPLEQNTIVLPDAADDYAINVDLASLADDTLATATTTISQLAFVTDYKNINLTTTDVERVVFAQPITDAVTLTSSPYPASSITGAANLPFEMLQLDIESYDNFVTFGAYVPDGLATQTNDPDLTITTSLSTGPASRGSTPVSAMQLGMAPADFGQSGPPKNFSFVNGIYQATDPTVGASFSYAIPSLPEVLRPAALKTFPSWAAGSLSFNGSVTPAEALAMVLQGVVNGEVTLAVVFRGWAQQADTSLFGNTESYYNLYAPLISALQSYLTQPGNTVRQVLLSGLDLGGSVVQWAMSQLAVPGVSVQGYTFGDLGAEGTGSGVIGGSGKIENFEEDTDPYYVLSQKTTTSVASVLAVFALETVDGAPFPTTIAGTIAAWIAGTVLSNNVDTNLFLAKSLTPGQVVIDGNTGNNGYGFGNAAMAASHSITTYQQDVGKIMAFAADSSSLFSVSILAQDLLAGTVDPEAVHIAVGSSGSQIVTIYDDNYALGFLSGYTATNAANGSNIGVVFRWNNLTSPPTEDQEHSPVIVDGGNDPGLKNILALPGSSNDYTTQNMDGYVELLYHNIPIADLYRIDIIKYTDPNVVNLDGSPVTIQTPTSGQTTLTADPSSEEIDTGNSNLSVIGSNAGDYIVVGDGNDTITEGSGDDIIVDGDPANAGNLTIVGGAGDSFIQTGAGNTTVVVGAGNDTIEFGVGGTNTLDFSNALAAVDVDLSAGTAQNGFGGTDTIANVQVVKGSAYNDTFTVGAGAETFIGGGGSETVVFPNAYATYTITYEGNDNGVVTDAAGDVYTLTDIQTLKFSDQTVDFDALPDQTYWLTAVSADFAAAIDWSGDAPPGPADNALIDAVGTYTVTNATNASVAALTVGAPGAQRSGRGGNFATRPRRAHPRPRSPRRAAGACPGHTASRRAL
jgi:autotransporter passenger strand-loop-strand repeat protein